MIRSPKNFAVGAIFIGLAAVFAISAMSLNIGTAGRMGPGYFPLMLAAALALLGLVLVVVGLRVPGDMPGRANVRAIVLVGLAVAVFAFGVRPLGLVPTVFASSFLFSLAGREFSLVSATVAALVLALGSWVLFVLGLRMHWAAFGTIFS
jgi:hypothetical protein